MILKTTIQQKAGNEYSKMFLEKFYDAEFITLSEVGKVLNLNLDQMEFYIKKGFSEEQYNVLSAELERLRNTPYKLQINHPDLAMNVYEAATKCLIKDYKDTLYKYCKKDIKVLVCMLRLVESQINRSIIFDAFDDSVMNPRIFCEIARQQFVNECDEEYEEVLEKWKIRKKLKPYQLMKLEKKKSDLEKILQTISQGLPEITI